jgi:hypothetical protein
MLQPAPERIRKLAIDALKENRYTIDHEWIRFVDKTDYRAYAVNVCGPIFADCDEDELALTVSPVYVTLDKEIIENSKFEQFTIKIDEV